MQKFKAPWGWVAALAIITVVGVMLVQCVAKLAEESRSHPLVGVVVTTPTMRESWVITSVTKVDEGLMIFAEPRP